MPADSSTTQPSDESTLNGTREVSGVHSLPCTTSTLSDASSFGPMQLGMEFDGEEASDVTDAPAHSDLPTLYDNQVLSQSFTFQVGKSVRWNNKAVNLQLFYFSIRRNLNYLLHQRRILKEKKPSMYILFFKFRFDLVYFMFAC
jgi:hypothetical protein